jgi:hypothetical protein
MLIGLLPRSGDLYASGMPREYFLMQPRPPIFQRRWNGLVIALSVAGLNANPWALFMDILCIVA